MLEAADEGGGGQFGRTGQFYGFQPRNQFAVKAVQLHPRQRGAEAEMHPVAERDMLVGVAADVEAEWLVEDLFVSVAGT